MGMFYLTALSGIFMTVRISMFFKNRKRCIELLSTGSLIVFTTTAEILRYISFLKHTDTFFQSGWINYVSLVCLSLLFLILSIPVVKFFNAYLPFMLGGRKIDN
jgi:hypothetical protein